MNNGSSNFEVCSCQCHKLPDSVKHCWPCCSPCQYCGQNIITGMFDDHNIKCKNNSKNLFIERYCHASKLSVEMFNESLVAMECKCGERGCSGWAVISNDEFSIKTHKELYGL